MTTRIQIDTSFLLRQVSALTKVRERHQTWNEFGELTARHNHARPLPVHVIDGRIEEGTSSEPSNWSVAKDLVYEVLKTDDPKHDGIRKRLGNFREPSTPLLLTTLSLWLAGVLGMSVSKTSPMVAAMLYAVAKSSNDWETLRN